MTATIFSTHVSPLLNQAIEEFDQKETRADTTEKIQKFKSLEESCSSLKLTAISLAVSAVAIPFFGALLASTPLFGLALIATFTISPLMIASAGLAAAVARVINDLVSPALGSLLQIVNNKEMLKEVANDVESFSSQITKDIKPTSWMKKSTAKEFVSTIMNTPIDQNNTRFQTSISINLGKDCSSSSSYVRA